MNIQNPFATAAGAARYHNGRPFHHPRAVARIFSVLGNPSVGRALDVACGTGLSTLALKQRVDLAVGIDSVEAMVRLAEPSSNLLYAVSAAERLPFEPQTFDLLTVSSGVHWFNQPSFFAEANRVLPPWGWLAIYDHFFEGAPDEPELDVWLKEEYVKRYPPPNRGSRPDNLDVMHDGFLEVDSFEYDDPIGFTHDAFVAYLLSQSNTVAAEADGRETAQETATWLSNQTARWFAHGGEKPLRFRAVARCLRATT